MHELALVEGIMDTVRISAEANGIQRVGCIKLIIGKLSMALPDSLQFVFPVCSSKSHCLPMLPWTLKKGTS